MNLMEKLKEVEREIEDSELLEDFREKENKLLSCLESLREIERESKGERREKICDLSGIVWNKLAFIHERKGDFERSLECLKNAMEYFSSVIEINPKRIDVLMHRGLINETIGVINLEIKREKEAKNSLNKAIEDYNSVILQAGKSQDALKSRGRVYEIMGDITREEGEAKNYYEKALGDNKMVITLNPFILTSYLRGVEIYLKLGMPQSADDMMAEMIKVIEGVKVKEGGRAIVNIGGKSFEEDFNTFAYELSLVQAYIEDLKRFFQR